MCEQLYRTKQVLSLRGISKSQHHEDIRNGRFVTPMKRGMRIALYPSSEVAALNAAEVAGKSEQEIRALVDSLHASRQKNPIAVYFAHGLGVNSLKQVIEHLELELKTQQQKGEK